MFSSPLQRAITRGLKPGGDLSSELYDLDDYTIRSRKDAKAICKALATLSMQTPDGKGFPKSLRALFSLFQDVDGPDCPAFTVLYDEGLPLLIDVFDLWIERDDDEDVDELLFLLKILAMYGSPEGASRIVAAARRPLMPDGYMWHVILSIFTSNHPLQEYIFDELSNPLPPAFIAVSLLDIANQTAIEGELPQHPFDSPDGWDRLRCWLEDRKEDNFSYAHSATAALPFMRNPHRDQLLALAMDHVDADVQMEAAWAAAKIGREAGLKILARYCLDVNRAEVAQRYLTELGREDMVPAEANNPSFRAQADFAGWLSHPNELGKPPDELEIVDHRQLAWPPSRELNPFWVIRYRSCDQTGLENDKVDCGLVGSMTWCFFSYKMNERPPEDVYAIHCYWEMEHAGLIEEAEVTDASEYAAMLGQWPGGTLQEPRVELIAELSPKLRVPGSLVAVASARLDGEEGWVVLHGPLSTWYAKSEQPKDTIEKQILMIHVGRQLLGFEDQPDRGKYLAPESPPREPRQIVEAYEKFIDEVPEADPQRQKDLLDSWSLLMRHYDAYVDALAEVNGSDKTTTTVDVYTRFLKIAEDVDESVRNEAHGSTSLLGEKFESYIDALLSSGRTGDIGGIIEFFATYWDNNLGFGRLGSAAFKANLWDVAEDYLSKLKEGMESCHRNEEMSFLAEIWHKNGNTQKARELLIDCMRKLVTEIQESKYNSDREMFAKEFHYHRNTCLRLFPGSESELAKLGIPSDPLS